MNVRRANPSTSKGAADVTRPFENHVGEGSTSKVQRDSQPRGARVGPRRGLRSRRVLDVPGSSPLSESRTAWNKDNSVKMTA